EIYGGLANTWDYGPLGSRLKNTIKDCWRKRFIQERPNAYEVDADILMHPRVWEASGHIASFSDPLMDCKECKMRIRADNLIEEYSKGEVAGDAMTNEEMYNYIIENKIPCPHCRKHNFTNIRQFNLLFKTNRGVTEDSQNTIYLRPETAQGQYVNFLNVQRTMRAKVPFGIGQIGKAFRNEITPGNFTFRTIEFEQMEHQWFCKEGQDTEYYEEYKAKAKDFYKRLGIKEEHLTYHDHDKLAFYAKAACDVFYKFPFGFNEVCGIHNRTNYDLSKHQEYSGKTIEYLDPITNEKFVPYVVEASFGADRATHAVLCEAYDVEKLEDGTEREVMRFNNALAPIKAAVFPLIKKSHSEKAREIYKELSKKYRVMYDETGSIGKRYRRQDSIGTPFCITVDEDTLTNNTVTVRERDSMKQEVVSLQELNAYLENKLNN
ncbi:MAG: glycine--tRNA ligase, partial [Clostridia bacterium]|nr:glycine--tRNA ligase [Clostridia bacterium]